MRGELEAKCQGGEWEWSSVFFNMAVLMWDDDGDTIDE